MKYLSKHGYVIPKNELALTQLTNLKQTLTAKPLVDLKYITNDALINYPVYIETTNKIYIPKMFGINQFGKAEYESPHYLGKEWDRDIPFTGNLYDYQVDPANKLIDACLEQGGGILNLATGYGKSITTLYVLSKLQSKTIIIVNKTPLMNQWISEINRFLPSAKVGVIQGQKNVKIHDCDIVVAMLQSLSKIDYPDSLFTDFKISVFDEVHNISSKCFSKVLFKVTTRYSIGLSATPNRSDGCEYVFKWHLGDIIFEGKTERKGKPPIIELIKLNSNEYREIATERYNKKQIQFTSMITELIGMSSRNELIISYIIKLITEENRKILVLSDRRNHLIELKTILDKKQSSLQFSYGLFIGNMKSEDLERSKRSNCILASYSAFGEGISEKDLDTLILITPKKFVGHLKNSAKNDSGKLEQIVGRIFRKEHVDKHPKIIDLCDNFSIYKAQSYTRKIFYKNHFTNAIFEEKTVDLNQNQTAAYPVSPYSTPDTLLIS